MQIIVRNEGRRGPCFGCTFVENWCEWFSCWRSLNISINHIRSEMSLAWAYIFIFIPRKLAQLLRTYRLSLLLQNVILMHFFQYYVLQLFGLPLIYRSNWTKCYMRKEWGRQMCREWRKITYNRIFIDDVIASFEKKKEIVVHRLHDGLKSVLQPLTTIERITSLT